MQIPFKLAANLWKASKSKIFVEEKFLTLVLSLKDIVAGLKSPMESFLSINVQSVARWEYACLSQKTA